MRENGAGDAASAKISMPHIALPKGGGTIKGMGEAFKADAFSGTGNYSIPIDIPQARALTPQLSLDYASGNGNGPFGLGFVLSTGAVRRRTDQGIPTYGDGDVFMLDSEGELTPELVEQDGVRVPKKESRILSGVDYTVYAYLPRSQRQFSLIEHWVAATDGTSWWKLVSRNNVTTLFGANTDSRIADPQLPRNIVEWLACETGEITGNRIIYEYKAENGDNLRASISNINRGAPANKYISKIKYGNFYDNNGAEQFAFQVAFDYGEYDVPQLAKSGALVDSVCAWSERDDPFSSFRSGFDIRTHRLCRAILVFYCFDELGAAPCLGKAFTIGYDASAIFSLATSITQTGYRRQSDGSVAQQSYPPLALRYSAFSPPPAPRFKPLILGAHEHVPAYIGGADVIPVDLCGEGVAGLLFTAPDAPLYCAPLGEGRYAAPVAPEAFPALGLAVDAGQSLHSLDGNGLLDLVVEGASPSGYFGQDEQRRWSAFRPFAKAPAQLGDEHWQSVDLSGDGRADLVLLQEQVLTVCLSLGREGYQAAGSTALPRDYPGASLYGATELVTFADMFGDGLMHRVRIRSGAVEAWPCLGYGRFAPRILFADAPVFPAQMGLPRIMLADVNGSGAQDLVLVHAGHVDVFLNQAGNSFAQAPMRVYLPENYTEADQIHFADVLGQGTAALVFTKAGPRMRQWYYNFCGEREGEGEGAARVADLKPYLLVGIDNNLGQVTELTYASSTRFYLEDKAAGRQWPTTLPFPVHVIEQVVTRDLIAGSRHTSSYRYHDGYYDPVEKQFRGFGYVESRDAETYDNYLAANAALNQAPISPLQYVAPVYTRTWRHTGAWRQDRDLREQYRADYFAGDAQAYVFPPDLLDPAIAGAGAETVRQAYGALAGTLMRQEIYAEDDSALALLPYTVGESNARVRLYQSAAGRTRAVFLVSDHESISYNYERNPADPAMRQQFVLGVDPSSGAITHTCAIDLPRRTGGPGASDDTMHYPEQYRIVASAAVTRYIDTDAAAPFRYRGIASQTQEMDIGGLASASGAYFTAADLAGVVAATAQPLTYEAPFDPALVQARLRTWNRTLFWNDAQSACLQAGQIAAHALVHHVEDAVFPAAFPGQVFGAKLTPGLLETAGGYYFDQDSGYWWNRATTSIYATDPHDFYLLVEQCTSFVPDTSDLACRVTVAYDRPYRLFPIATSVYLDQQAAPTVNTTSVEIDYASLQARVYRDVNGNTAQALFDPLGQVVVTSTFGLEDGVAVGGMDLSTGEYQVQGDASLAAVLAAPEQFLQGASSYFYYDLLAWKDQRQPPCALSLVRCEDYRNGATLTPFSCQRAIAYCDGFGRALARKMCAAAPPDERWVVLGRTVYNNKGMSCAQYQPYFSATPLFERQDLVGRTADTGPGGQDVPPPTVTRYDPLLRPIRIDTPKGFFSQRLFTPWQEQHYDENDTVLDSAFYQSFMASYPADPTPEQVDEMDALRKAAACYATPLTKILDNTGRTIRTIGCNLGSVDASLFDPLVQGTSTSAAALLAQLLVKGYLYDAAAPAGIRVSPTVRPYQPGFALSLDPPFAQFGAGALALLRQSCLTSFSAYDSAGREVLVIDPRLYLANIESCASFYNFRYRYAMGASTPVLIDSIDAGLQRHASNIFGDQFWSLSPRNYCQLVSYDSLRRRTAVRICQVAPDAGAHGQDDFRLVEQFVYGELAPQAAQRNLRGQLYQARDLAGVQLCEQYGLRGNCLKVSRQLALEYKAVIDWNSVPPPALAPDIHVTRFCFDAVGNMLSEIAADGSVIARRYDPLGQPTQVTVTRGAAATDIIGAVSYDANGSPLAVDYGNGIVADNAYDPATLRLVRLRATRPGGTAGAVQQDLRYAYDAAGNVTRCRNNAYATVFARNQKVDPLSDYGYDALYRLLRATGRQHPGINAGTFRNNAANGSFKQSLFSQLPAANDGEQLENYAETYDYDDAGNLLGRFHAATSASWRSSTPVAPDSNRLAGVEHDASGNMRQLQINNNVGLAFNCCERLVRAAIIERPDEEDDCDYYVYDSGGQRLRKVGERMASGGAVTQIDERIVIGNLEIVRTASEAGGVRTVLAERHDLRVPGINGCAAISQLVVAGAQAGLGQLRYQLGDRQGAIADEYGADAQLISHEEYFPYGGTALIAGASQAEVKLKTYRYSGQQCDDSTGLYYYGARYYPPWLGRWLSADPAGTVDGPNLYAFVAGNPLTHVDAGGMALTAPHDRATLGPGMVAPHPAFGGAAPHVHFGMNGSGIGSENQMGFYGYRDNFVTAGQGIMAETSWRHIFGNNAKALGRAHAPSTRLREMLLAGVAAGGAIGAKLLGGFGMVAAVGGTLGGAILGFAGVGLATVWWRGRNARQAALNAPLNGAASIGRAIRSSYRGNEDFTNRVMAPADQALYLHAVTTFSGNKNVVTVATQDNLDQVRLGIRYSKAAIDYAFATPGAEVHFHLDGLVMQPAGMAQPDFSPSFKNSNVTYGPDQRVADSVTAHELRYLARRLHRNNAAGTPNPTVTYYLGGMAQAHINLPPHTAFGSRQ